MSLVGVQFGWFLVLMSRKETEKGGGAARRISNVHKEVGGEGGCDSDDQLGQSSSLKCWRSSVMRARSREITRVDESRSTPKWGCYCRFEDAADFPGQKNTGMGRELYSVERKGETGGREGKVRSEGEECGQLEYTKGHHGRQSWSEKRVDMGEKRWTQSRERGNVCSCRRAHSARSRGLTSVSFHPLVDEKHRYLPLTAAFPLVS